MTKFIIPLREKIGNYDTVPSDTKGYFIIPLREKIGNYDVFRLLASGRLIIPLREKIGNYDMIKPCSVKDLDYTTTRENWELRPVSVAN